jgi:prepilin-type N-terminal cleavage/methylation domain-containing protein
MQKKGFTLIELLVVIAIISILASIIFPVFITARKKAAETACANNLHQIGVAILDYTNDYDDHLPPCAAWGYAWVGRAEDTGRYLPGYEDIMPRQPEVYMPELLIPYLKNEKTLWCPEIPPSTPFPGWPGHTLAKNSTSYAWIHATPSDPDHSLFIVSGTLYGNIPKPAEAFLVADALWWGKNNPKGEGSEPPHEPHHVMVLYADWHVRICDLEEDDDFWRQHGCDGYFEH